MSQDFFEKPFDQETLVKLKLYEDYLMKWIPVFVATNKSFVNTINIFDFFSGAGCDSEGILGSPLLALKSLMEYSSYIKEKDLSINLFLNDYNVDYCERLLKNIEEFNYDNEQINVQVYNQHFENAYDMLRPKMDDSANLIFLDQFGIKYVSKNLFQQLTKIPFTDILFFISSATFKRFSKDENISEVIEIDPERVENTLSTHIHKLVTEQYASFIPEDVSYGIAPFSIKKGSNVYGLIFGSGHPLGMEKFLEVCWEKDELTGEANFDIEGEGINKDAPFLFQEMNVPSKIEVFQNELKGKILRREVKNDVEIYLYMINNGFLGQHVRPVIQELKQEGRIKISHPSFKCSTVLNKNRKPKTITIL